jgi:hypothetical protein
MRIAEQCALLIGELANDHEGAGETAGGLER